LIRTNYFFQKIENSGVIERKRKRDQKFVIFYPQTKIFGTAFTAGEGGSGLVAFLIASPNIL